MSKYIARFKDGQAHYRVLCPYQAIGTIDKDTYDQFKSGYKTRANQFVKTLIINSYDEYSVVRRVYKSSTEK